jgi:hypothetical protein
VRLEVLLDLVHHKVRHLVAEGAVAVVDAKQRLLVGFGLAKRVAHAAAILVDLCRRLARPHPGLDAMARIRANVLEGERERGLGLDDPHLGAARGAVAGGEGVGTW